MKIAFVIFTDFPEGDAAARRVHTMAKGLVTLGHDVHVVVPQRFNPGPLFQVIDGLQVHWGTVTTRETWSRFSERLTGRRSLISLVNQLAANGLDWLVLYNLGMDGLPLVFIARYYGVKIATDYCDLRTRADHPTIMQQIQYLWLTAADQLIPRFAQLNIVISRLLEQRLHSIAPQIPTLLIPPLVDTDRFHYQAVAGATFRAKWGIAIDLPVISYLGGYWNVDGVGVLLKAASELQSIGKQFKLVISGASLAGRDCDDVALLVDELHLQDQVILTGWLATDQVIAAMSAADILVVPKLDHIINRAGVPTKLAEYLAIGRAVVASDIGDIPLYLTDGQNASLCRPGNSHSLAEALLELIDEPARRDKLSIQAKFTANKFFDYRSVAKTIENSMLSMSKRHRLNL